MKKLFSKIVLMMLLSAAFAGQAMAQNEAVGVEYRNITIAPDGQSFTFQVWAFKVEPAYTALAAPWNTFNIRFDVVLTGGATGIGTMGASNVSPGIAQSGNASNNPAGGVAPKFGVTFNRAGGPDLTVAPQLLGTVTVPVTGGQVSGATVLTTRDSPTSPTGTQTFWNSTVSPLVRRSLTTPDPTPLPVTLISFEAAAEAGIATLNWATTEEVNADRFEIQRSANAKTWAAIGSKQAAGNSSALQQYTFADNTPANGINYYRLKMIDRDGTFGYSRIASAEFHAPSVSVYPNPVASTVQFKGLQEASVSKVEIVNAAGVKVYQAAALSSTGINVERLPQGLYLVTIDLKNGSTQTQKLLIAR